MTNTNFDIWSMLFFLPLLILITGCGTNIGGGTALPSNFKWTPPNEADLYTCEITGEHALQWCEMDTLICVIANYLFHLVNYR